MDREVKYPCKQCLVGVCCTKHCELVTKFSSSFIRSCVINSICPLCGQHTFDKRSIDKYIVTDKEAYIAYKYVIECTTCNNKFSRKIENSKYEMLDYKIEQ